MRRLAERIDHSCDHMSVEISRVTLEAIQSLRDRYRQEMNCQIVHDSLHARFFTDIYLIRLNDQVAGYGCLMNDESDARDLIKEYYVVPVHRASALPLFRGLLAASNARAIEAQTNDTLLSLMLFDCAAEFTSETILFSDAGMSKLSRPEITFRKVIEPDRERIFPHKLEGVGDWLI